MILFVMVLFPMTGLITLSNIACKLTIPSFIELNIAANPLFAASFSIFYILLVIAEIAVFFSINIYVLQKKNFFQSCTDSWKLGRNRFMNTVVCMLVLSVILISVKLFFRAGTAADALSHIIRAVFVHSVNNAGITALFYRYYEEDESLAGIHQYVFRTAEPAGWQKIVLTAAAVLLLCGSLYECADTYAFLAEGVRIPSVCAHRGDKVHAPENSYEAFEAAVSEGLPWIELDVQLTADNVVVVEHDSTLLRRFVINRAVADMSYPEIMQHTVNGMSDSNDKDVRITTLEDVLLLAEKNDMMV